MRLLVDANLSPALIEGLVEAGFEALHVGDVDLLTPATQRSLRRRLGPAGVSPTPDPITESHRVSDGIEYARSHDLVIVTVDSDFAAMLAITGTEQPSVVQLRDVGELAPPV